jgi:hypothetical protein
MLLMELGMLETHLDTQVKSQARSQHLSLEETQSNSRKAHSFNHVASTSVTPSALSELWLLSSIKFWI